MTANQIRRRVFHDLGQLITAIGNHIDRRNKNPKPFIWTAKASNILENVTRALVKGQIGMSMNGPETERRKQRAGHFSSFSGICESDLQSGEVGNG